MSDGKQFVTGLWQKFFGLRFPLRVEECNEFAAYVFQDGADDSLDYGEMIDLTNRLNHDIPLLVDALRDMLGGWRYIRQFHGELYGVGWDRAQQKAEAALAAVAQEQPRPEDSAKETT